MKKAIFILAATVGLAWSSSARAQDFGGGLWDIVQQNAAFDAMAQQQAANIAQQFLIDRTNYRMQTGDWSYIPGPVSQADVQRSIAGMNQAFQSYNDAWHGQSQRMSDAVDRWSTAFRGDWYYTNPNTGETQVLPYTSNGYSYGPNGWAANTSQGGNNFYLSNGYRVD
jgi:hypothetical protein